MYSIYMQPKHAMINRWIAITNEESDFNTITGYIKASTQVVHVDDKRNNLELLATTNKEAKIILPP